jgi:hypothetical protein
MVACDLAKVIVRVRFSVPAPNCPYRIVVLRWICNPATGVRFSLGAPSFGILKKYLLTLQIFSDTITSCYETLKKVLGKLQHQLITERMNLAVLTGA